MPVVNKQTQSNGGNGIK